MNNKNLKLGIVGGTGKEGAALALRFGSRGYIWAPAIKLMLKRKRYN